MKATLTFKNKIGYTINFIGISLFRSRFAVGVLIGKHDLDSVSQSGVEPDPEKLGYCPKCGVRPCDCENVFGEEKAG